MLRRSVPHMFAYAVSFLMIVVLLMSQSLYAKSPIYSHKSECTTSLDEWTNAIPCTSRGENLLDTLIYHGLSCNTLTEPTYFGYKFTPSYPCTLLAGWVFLWTNNHPCTLLVYDWPPGPANLIQKVPFTTTTQWNWIDLPTPYFDPDTFFVGFHFDGSTYLNHDFGPGNGRGYSSDNGITWSPTWLGNNALIRAIVRYETPSKDAAAKTIDYPGHLFTPDSVVTPVATVKNTGQDTISFDVLCTVDTSGVGIYSSMKSVADLPPDSTYQVTFDDWSPAGSGYPCLLKVVTQLVTDSLTANDTLELTTTPYTPLTTIPSGWTLSPPTIDGTIDTTSEWFDAFCIDVSDLDGRYNKPVSARNIFLYVMNDDSALYLAVDYHTTFHEESNSRFFFYYDDNNDGVWASDSSEGYYKLANNHVYWDVFYSRPTSWWVNVSSELIDAQVSATYHLTYEVSIPLHDATRWLLNASPGDTVGFHCFMHSQDARTNYRWPMWWPTLMDSSYQEEPGYYGDIVLASDPVGIGFYSFTADVRDDGVLLTWRAESETNAMEWLLERSLKKDDNYNRIATVQGNGTTPAPTTYNWLDDGVEVGNTYYYKLGAVDINGNITWYGPVSATLHGTFGKLVLNQNSPNPFRGLTSIEYHLPRTAFVNLSIYDVTGRLIRKIVHEEQRNGLYNITWNGKDNLGKLLPSGIYYCRLSQGNNTKTRKILFVK